MFERMMIALAGTSLAVTPVAAAPRYAEAPAFEEIKHQIWLSAGQVAPDARDGHRPLGSRHHVGNTIANLELEERVLPKPVFAGDTIPVETEVVAMRESQSRPTQGLVPVLHTAFNPRGRFVCTSQRVALMMKATTA